MLRRSQRGFSLIELMLSMAIISALAGLSLPLYYSFLARNDLRLQSETVAMTIRRAQLYARAGKQDSAWAVRVQADAITLYKGTTYASRDTAYDETSTFPGTVTASGATDLSFAKLTGVPISAGTITLTSQANEAKGVAINAKGTVSF